MGALLDAAPSKLVKCPVCSAQKFDGRSSECPECVEVRNNIQVAHANECRAPHPRLESRMREFERRVEVGQPLFGDVTLAPPDLS